MRALDHKLFRDLWRLKGQVIAIAIVIASGVAVLVMSLTALDSLEETAHAYYERYRFAHVFANVKRAPERLARRIAEIPGVQAVETRISKFATLDLEHFAEPAIGRLISTPERGESTLNQLALRKGRLVAPGRDNEVVLSEPFAEAHGFRPGDRFDVIMNGNKRKLEVVGIALSPEFVYAIAPGSLTSDDERYGVGWMGRKTLEAAYDLDGAFNDVSLTLLRGIQPEAVIERLDQLLDRYGGTGAFARADQISNWFLMNELEQLETVSSILPAIFLAVAAFLTNMVLARLIATERSEIGLMKAFGYSNVEVGWHYAKMVIAMSAVGIVLGWAVGAWLGQVNTQIYAEFYRFPFLFYRVDPAIFGLAALVSLGAALAGTIGAVRRAAALPPAEAMRPPTPPIYKRTRLGGTRLARWLDQPTRIVLRQIARWPLRSVLTSTGVGLSVGVLVMANQWHDSIEHSLDVYFYQAQRQDMMVALVEARSSAAVFEFERLPGVMAAEPMRTVSADFRVGTRNHRGTIEGVRPDATLHLVYDAKGGIVHVPQEGLLLSTKLAEKLGVGVGDSVWVEIRQGRRPTLQVPVVRLFETYIGMPAYMDLRALDRMLLERPSVEYVNLLVDESEEPALLAALKNLPAVSAVMLRRAAVDAFRETVAETLLIYIGFFTVFAGALALGVVYNTSRIALSERGRELATLRVLGFSRTEISYILLSELALLVLVALPLGCVMGFGLAWIMTSAFETEIYRVPMVIEASTYGTSMLVALAVTIVSAALVRRRLDRLDLIAVLKTRE
ncbi:MAG: FtsX-like permease family protein [Gammaproteobacteria bacterium]|jgi:putative ABC transport system permease protein|nr:FtsX-like permease family protein [Gammaproteobacteria bacterium]